MYGFRERVFISHLAYRIPIFFGLRDVTDPDLFLTPIRLTPHSSSKEGAIFKTDAMTATLPVISVLLPRHNLNYL